MLILSKVSTNFSHPNAKQFSTHIIGKVLVPENVVAFVDGTLFEMA